MTRYTQIQKVQIGGLILLGIIILVYTLFTSRQAIAGIRINLSENSGEYQTREDPLFSIKGIVRHAEKLTVNSKPIVTDKKGAFNDTILLAPGYNVVVIEAEDKFGNTDKKIMKVVLKNS